MHQMMLVLEGLEKNAREAKKGLWADPAPSHRGLSQRETGAGPGSLSGRMVPPGANGVGGGGRRLHPQRPSVSNYFTNSLACAHP